MHVVIVLFRHVRRQVWNAANHVCELLCQCPWTYDRLHTDDGAVRQLCRFIQQDDAIFDMSLIAHGHPFQENISF